ncbi:LacI family transcriptional regulator [Kineosphaera limosa]|uniref:Putative LacI family transcriptional regulator n=1 Tax=Kineosphaera limosa NBRC 100340 TaxID=1184609 RepID=K6WUQ0_9MICO|nr:LacI family DNA-binding transcriptional regulator [Kineosphaera limosa]NYE00447.1 LacI family transcriptional regulator [Kineosphaera limosa]GAB97576.1 putative LacI family transcriptional regulator [Kineosphaera limosa NBRC 100340]
MSNRVKAADVARLAGVSRTAVSFVLNGRAEGNISAATADRVRAAAAELGYTPDRVAQSLRLQRTNVIGLLTDGIASSPFAGRILSGAMDRAAESGFVLVVADTQGHADREVEAVEEFSRRRIDGLLYASMKLREAVQPPTTSLPLVLANCSGADPHAFVVPDNANGGKGAARHLLELGHRRIVMLGGPGDPAGEQRSGAFRAVLAHARLPGAATCVIGIGRMWSIDVGYQWTVRTFTDSRGHLRSAATRPTAVFAVNDRVATGALLALGQLGLRVPHDVSVVGFDDQEQLAAHVVPALTTFALPFRQMGEMAADRLVAAISTREPVRLAMRLPCPLVVRESTGPPPSSDSPVVGGSEIAAHR